jgi:ATPase family protein associated with various cellular activities (AAA)
MKITFKGIDTGMHVQFMSDTETVSTEPDGTLIVRTGEYEDTFSPPVAKPAAASEAPPTVNTEKDLSTHTQWAIAGNNRFIPIGASVNTVPPGVYEGYSTQTGIMLEKLNVRSDNIYELPDMQTLTVLRDVDAFWSNEHRYKRYGLLFKRGLLLYGPPGGGKTACIKLLMNELVNRGGIVLLVQHAGVAIESLKAIRRIEPDRQLIAVYEDIDEIIRYNGEAAVLSMLDGEHNVDRVLNLATTNYPEQLGARIINRPSRFDRRIAVGMPTYEARAHYLRKCTKGELSEKDIKRWAKDTDGLSIAHLRELIAAVHCLDQPYGEVLVRLKEMGVQVRPEEEFKKARTLGFAGARA